MILLGAHIKIYIIALVKHETNLITLPSHIYIHC